MNSILNSFQQSLIDREIKDIKRTLKSKSNLIDFYSNDYLGLAKNHELHHKILSQYNQDISLLFGSTGSRLISGNSDYITTLENYIAKEHHYESALLFSSGYQANLGLFSAILDRNNTLLVDENIHRSVHDGCRLSFSKKLKFKHNDLQHLEQLLQKVNGKCFVAVESLYSMNGDFAPLVEICALVEQYNAALIVDEAHAFGVFGHGLVHQNNLQNRVLATVITYGKALGIHGAAILTNQITKDFLINFSSPFIYTTAMPDFHLTGLKIGYEFLKNQLQFKEKLHENISLFRNNDLPFSSDIQSPIQIIQFENTNQLRKVQKELEEDNMQTFAVFSPTVKAGEERLRICLHVFNQQEEIEKLIKILSQNV